MFTLRADRPRRLRAQTHRVACEEGGFPAAIPRGGIWGVFNELLPSPGVQPLRHVQINNINLSPDAFVIFLHPSPAPFLRPPRFSPSGSGRPLGQHLRPLSYAVFAAGGRFEKPQRAAFDIWGTMKNWWPLGTGAWSMYPPVRPVVVFKGFPWGAVTSEWGSHGERESDSHPRLVRPGGRLPPHDVARGQAEHSERQWPPHWPANTSPGQLQTLHL